MGHWGWRPLMAVFVSVWVVGCSATHDTAPTLPPTSRPSVTLTVRTPITPTPPEVAQLPILTTVPFSSPTPFLYVLQRGDTLLSVSRQFGVPVASLETANPGLNPLSLQIGQSIIIANPRFNTSGSPILPTATPLQLPLFPPACYETATTSILCLGSVHNNLRQPVGRVSVWVTVFGRDGQILAQGETGVEQVVIPPGQRAPYRALLQADWRDYAGATAALRSAEVVNTVELTTPAVEQERGSWSDGRYVVSAELHNTTMQPMHLVRAIVTLYNRTGQVAGYRVVPINRVVSAGEVLPLTVEIAPMGTDSDLTHSLYIETGVSG